MFRKSLVTVILSLVLLLLMISCKNPSSGTFYSSEGTPLNPLVLSLDDPHQGSVGPLDISYYRFTTLDNPDPGSYRITMENLVHDADIALGDADYIFIASSENWGTTDELIEEDLSGAAMFNVIVADFDGQGTSYTLRIESLD